jgi:hypothetical protein
MRHYIDVEAFRTTVVTSATLSLEEVPVQQWQWGDAKGTRYRDISKYVRYGGIRLRLSQIAFSLPTLLAVVLGGAMLAMVLAPVVAGRWASWGFSTRLVFVVWVVWMLGIGRSFWRDYSQQTANIALGIKLARDADTLGLVTSSISLAQTQALELAFKTHPLTVVMLFGVVGLGLPLLLYTMVRGVLRWVIRGFKPNMVGCPRSAPGRLACTT